METLSYAVTDEAVENLLNFIPEIFDSHFVRDIAVRRQVCKQLLADSSFVEFVSDRFDLGEALNNGGILGRSIDFQESSKPTVSISSGLTTAQRSVIVNNNLDYSIVFKEGNSQPHALAYAQRVVDTARCKACMNYRRGTVIDVGGNYATHAMTGAIKIHSCTLRDDVEEYHRQVQRDVNLEMGDFETPSMCTGGVQECDVYAPEAFSLHTLPRIDPNDIPSIFQQHGLEFMTGVHHYDTRMDTETSGFVPDVDMHWQVNDGFVEFFFEQDSSYPYKHRLDWLKQYSHSNFFSDSRYTFLVYFAVERIEHGMVYWNMTRLDKATLGFQVLQPQYRYTEVEECLTIEVPKFNESSSFPVTDPRAYELVSVVVPVELFSFVYKAAVSNDTSRPDLPISLDQTRDFAHTFNYTRKVNGTSVTADFRLSSEHIDMIARGIYLIVVQRTAQLRAATTEYTKMFLRIQKRWGDENFLYLMSKCFSRAAIFPFILMADNIASVTDLVAVHMRTLIRSTKVLAAVTEELPYHLLSPIQQVTGTAKIAFTRTVDDVQTTVEEGSDDIDLQRFYEAFKDELAPEHARVLRDKIMQQQDQARIQVEEAIAEVELPEVKDTRESWEDAMETLAEKVPIQVVHDFYEASQDEVLTNLQYRIYEAGLYNFDVALNVIAAARERCSETWTGTTYKSSQLTSRNNTTDVGIKYLRVIDGFVQSNQGASEYSVALDPNTHELLYLPDDESSMKIPTNADYVFVFNPFKIFLGLILGRKLANFARYMKQVRPCVMRLVDGVPGCGKTHEIVSKFTPEDLIACAVRETAQNTRKRVLSEKPFVSASRTRTIDSCIINSTPKAKVLYVDEGLMVLPGATDYVAQSSKASVVEVYGDSAQIGFIDRGSKLGILRFPKLVAWEQIEYRNVSVRIPADVCFAIRQFYPEWRRSSIKTRSPVRRSVEMYHVPELESPYYRVPEPNVTMMSIVTMDKDKMVAKPGFLDAKVVTTSTAGVDKCIVLTVHEAQGIDVPHSTVVRLNVFDNPIFSSKPHLLVAMTRHTNTLRVVSTVSESEDPMMKLARIAVSATEEDLDDCQVETPDWLSRKVEAVKPRGSLVSDELL